MEYYYIGKRSIAKRSILIGSLSGPNFHIRTAQRWTAYGQMLPNCIHEDENCFKSNLFGNVTLRVMLRT